MWLFVVLLVTSGMITAVPFPQSIPDISSYDPGTSPLGIPSSAIVGTDPLGQYNNYFSSPAKTTTGQNNNYLFSPTVDLTVPPINLNPPENLLSLGSSPALDSTSPVSTPLEPAPADIGFSPTTCLRDLAEFQLNLMPGWNDILLRCQQMLPDGLKCLSLPNTKERKERVDIGKPEETVRSETCRHESQDSYQKLLDGTDILKAWSDDLHACQSHINYVAKFYGTLIIDLNKEQCKPPQGVDKYSF
ncbi:hypothetical protein MMC07_005947 [Pseudocyphellaria aurata]|nr:hypothetical protein [Pseudocyphellaria aurata]